MRQLGAYLLVAGFAAVVTWLATPVVIRLAHRFGAVDRPEARKVHATPIPSMGGLAMWAGFVAALLLSSQLPRFGWLFEVQWELYGVAAGVTLMAAVGVVDDTKGLTAPAKLAAQVLAAGVMVAGGVQMGTFWLPFFNTVSLTPELAVPLTVFIIVATVNAVNLVDGLDGLAAGLVAIGAAAYFVYLERMSDSGLFVGSTPAPLIAAITIGVCVGFLPHNFNPARVFMGDTGALLLGTLLAGAMISGVGQTTEPRAAQGFVLISPVLIPILVLALPFFDTGFALVRRLRAGQGIMVADKAHLHHRLLRVGHSHRNTVLLLWLWAAFLATSTVALSFTGPTRVLPFFLLFVVAGVALFLVPQRRIRRKEAERVAAVVAAAVTPRLDALLDAPPQPPGTVRSASAEGKDAPDTEHST